MLQISHSNFIYYVIDNILSQKRVDTLIGATRKEDLFPFKSLNFEALHGDKEGMFSIRVDMQYRLEFSLEEVGGESLVTICQLEELSNHYK